MLPKIFIKIWPFSTTWKSTNFLYHSSQKERERDNPHKILKMGSLHWVMIPCNDIQKLRLVTELHIQKWPDNLFAQWVYVAWGWIWKCTHTKQGSGASGKTPKHLTLTQTYYTHIITISVQINPGNNAQSCHQQWAPLLSSPMHLIALPNIWRWSQQVHNNVKFFVGSRNPNTPTDQKIISLPHLLHTIYSKAMPAQKYF